MKPVSSDDRHDIFSKTPFMRHLGMKREFSRDGQARVTLEPAAELGNVIGAVHGGVVVTMLDVAMASAAVSCIDFTKTVVTLNLNSSFIEPGRGALVADGEVVRRDDAVAWCRARVVDASGRLVAQAQGSFRYLPYPKTE
jgi:uncharacterized protein (TIGR00369 family)